MRIVKNCLLVVLLATFTKQPLIAQNTNDQYPNQTAFEKGMFSLKLGDTLTAFQLIQSAYTFSEKNDNISYQYISLLLALQKPNAIVVANNWLTSTQNAIYHSRVNYQLGKFYFKKKMDKEALDAFSKVSIDDLENDDIIDMKFYQGYSYFKTGDWSKASDLLNNIRQIKSNQFYIDANYYAGFIALEKKEFTKALTCFKICENSPTYSRLVPFYISQLYYFTGNIDAALVNCEKALQNKDQYYTLELEQLMGHLLFEKKEYKRALPYLANYVSKKKDIETQDLYQLSFCYYENQNWENAIDGFKKLASVDDSLGQNSMYLLATSYLKINNKEGAKNAFLLCATKSENKAQQEIALFNYAKLTTEAKEYNVAIHSFEKLFTLYPKSIYTDEAKDLWITALTYSNNYQKALDAFENISNPSNELLKVYPNILYGKACLLVNDGQIEKAYTLFNQIMHLPYNNKVLSNTLFWLGELAYKKGETQLSITYFEKYLLDPIENGTINKNHATYSLAYGYLKNNNYQKALDHFSTVLSNYNENSSEPFLKDAFVRMGDCQMMLKQYKKALNTYQRIIDVNGFYTDYATLQKANILGGMGKPKEKIALLKSFDDQFEKSNYINDARTELADTYSNQEQFQMAIAPLSQILLDKNASEFYPAAYYKLGMVYYNLDKNEASIQTFKELFAKYPKSTEAENAIEIIKNIFIENQNPESFVQFMNEYGKPLSVNEQDSLVYKSSIIKYDQQKYTEASNGFIKYLNDFPNGKYQLDAKYLIAEIAYSKDQYDSAAKYFALVAEQAPNKFAERASLLAARLYYFELKQVDKAEHYFTLLSNNAVQQENKNEASKGLLRCQYKLNKWQEAFQNANQIVVDKNAAFDDLQMATMIIYHNLMENKDTTNAIQLLNKINKQSPSSITAEAHYLTAQLYFQTAKYALAEKIAFDVIKKQSAYPYWVTSAYLLLGDIYLAQNDLFNATATYKSVFENADIPELKSLADQKLKALNNK